MNVTIRREGAVPVLRFISARIFMQVWNGADEIADVLHRLRLGPEWRQAAASRAARLRGRGFLVKRMRRHRGRA